MLYRFVQRHFRFDERSYTGNADRVTGRVAIFRG